MTSQTPLLRIETVSKIFGHRIIEAETLLKSGVPREQVIARTGATPALVDISLDIAASKTTVLLGLSGSGKSTLLRLMNRLISPTSGCVFNNGMDLSGLDSKALRQFRRDHVAMVFQQFGLLPHRTVQDNIAFGLELAGFEVAKRRAAADDWIEKVGLNGFETAMPSELSGGMRQRVGLARALATGADCLLMDEPFSALDPLTRKEMQDLLIDLQQQMRKTIVFVTHDVTEAFRLGDHLALLQDAKLVQEGPPLDLLKSPKTEYVRAFMKTLDILQGLNVRHVMTDEKSAHGGIAQNSSPPIPADETLSYALRQLNQADSSLPVIDGAGKPIGLIDLPCIQALLKTVS